MRRRSSSSPRGDDRAGTADIEDVLWIDQRDADDTALPRSSEGQLPASVDVVVVGAGYAGLSAARVLAHAGRHVLVLEKERLGWGAHARNGGMVIPELKEGPAALRKTYGELGLRMYREVNEAFDHVEALIADEGIDCDYERTGQLYLAHAERVVPHLQHLAAEHAEGFGEAVRFVPRDELAAEIGSDAFHGAVQYDRTGSLHPARFHAGIARLAIDAGAVVRDRCAATSLDLIDDRFRVGTVEGVVEAADVIVATNAYADGLLPALRRRVLPIGSFIVATEPLSPELARAVSPRRRMFVDTKNLLSYWRLTPDDRMLFGGRRSLASVSLAEVSRYLTEAMHRIHPQLRDVPVTHRWGGNVAITLDRMPHAGRIRGAWYATGCNGSGVALNTWLGHRLGLLLLGEAPAPAVAELRSHRIPLHRWRRAYLPIVGRYYQFQDRG